MRIVYTNQVKRDMKRMLKRGKSTRAFEDVADRLIASKKLLPKHKDHPLVGEWKGSRDCHIEPDWILIYTKCKDQSDHNMLIFERTGSHSDLFL